MAAPNIRAHVVRDETYPEMWRVQWPDGRLSDMVNLSRANDAAACFNETVERERRGRQTPAAARTAILEVA
jgi:hypothetical protein